MKTAEIIDAAHKVGGHFRLTALLQKRVVELMRGSPPLVENPDKKDLIGTALREVLEGKIILAADTEGEPEKAKGLRELIGIY
ncbi:MAG: DNA-directed RNA polymerase subunit omega [Planctomycetes bacterium]|jgi:DNA-directed RNA polymerase subunit omega|nr:DNA-directed RNA polymerase subunit omega [Planctomycetota bacterium]